jgi:hypothetical protein
MAYYAGKTGFISIGNFGAAPASRLALEEWSLELEVEEVDATNFESYGMNSIMPGIRGGTVSGSGPYESASGSDVLTRLQAGLVCTVELGLVQTGSIGFTVNVVITGATVGNNVREKPTFEFTGTLTNMDNAGVIQSTQNQGITQS